MFSVWLVSIFILRNPFTVAGSTHPTPRHAELLHVCFFVQRKLCGGFDYYERKVVVEEKEKKDDEERKDINLSQNKITFIMCCDEYLVPTLSKESPNKLK